MLCRWPQSQSSDAARPHLCKLARHGPWSVRKRFSSVHYWRGRSKPGCWIVASQGFCRLVTSVALLTDNAGELDGRLVQEICQLLETDKQRTSFCRPAETNFVAEKFHANLNSMIMGLMVTLVSDHNRHSERVGPSSATVMAAYSAS